MPTPDNTLLGRCTVAYVEGFDNELTSSISQPQARRTGVASLLDHLAAEIAVMLERNPNLTPHQLITILRMEAAGELAGWDVES